MKIMYLIVQNLLKSIIDNMIDMKRTKLDWHIKTWRQFNTKEMSNK